MTSRLIRESLLTDAAAPAANDAAPSAPGPDLGDSRLYIHRELSQLKFNIRVLDQALDERTPLLERLKFLLIFSANMDEFFEIRVAGLKGQIALDHEMIGPDGIPPKRALAEISEIAHRQIARQYAILNERILPELATHGIRIVRRTQWTHKQKLWVRRYFREEVAPLVTPIGLDPTHPFPLLVNKSLNFIVRLDGVDAFGRDSGLAIVPAPRVLPRLIRMPLEICEGGGDNYVLLSSIIHAHAEELFPGMAVLGCYQFRLTRNADLTLDPEDVEDLALALRGELYSRRFGDAVRLEVADNCPKELTDYLLKQFGLNESELYEVNGPVNLARLFRIANNVSYPKLQYPPFTPALPKVLQHAEDLFEVIGRQDVLLLHPYESFAPVVDLLRQASADPKVLAIKQTLYRTNANSEIVDALVDAARAGKEVTAVVELRARFDEESNLSLASRLQQAGAMVIYGVVGIKTHAKLMLVQRREGSELARYAHLGTGNYHTGNARVYTDYSLLTSDEALCEDVHKLFSQLTGMGKVLHMKKLLHAPFTLKKTLLELIARESAHAAAGKPAQILIKVNALTEPKVIRALYKASIAGVQVDLIVRGICCLRPGVAGVSENIRVRSIIGRFLEHSRVYWFANDGEPQLYLSSADLMERNLDRRVETAFPIDGKKLQHRVRQALELYLTDNASASLLQPDGEYLRLSPAAGEPVRNVQVELMEKLCGAGAGGTH
ncbi:RNA degradosome polyphosphate kinase [Rhodanobacter thiooxydans]|uniref:Polyphosphate kinase n=1 Tax=Rhodanobacter thiooxydans TaxID=416169 RepID=A0A154QKW5_9GAMM|nr:polyphosphate kinase 1 [Rhodanobacter thiooxydans]EIL97477.1 polyphosphate kinase [Rhodanobacter thiooxydans LCS2]KZC24781.1 RNA degradosome polyphosphate kinase [Rhodanobacter thiooxydans]